MRDLNHGVHLFGNLFPFFPFTNTCKGGLMQKKLSRKFFGTPF